MAFPQPTDPVNTTTADIYTAVFYFIESYGLPAMSAAPDTGRIFRGYSNRMVLPADNEYAVMTIVGQRRRGTNIETFDASKAEAGEKGDAALYELIFTDVQIDFYSEANSPTDYARLRAQAIETIGRSPWGVKFFKQHGISCLYCDDARDLSTVTDSAQYVSRWSVTLHLSHINSISAKLPWFDKVTFQRLENVDVHHPPQK